MSKNTKCLVNAQVTSGWEIKIVWQQLQTKEKPFTVFGFLGLCINRQMYSVLRK